MKNERHSAILNLISQRRISTQDELVEALRESGYPVTQATISRDIRDLGLSKELDEQGVARYITAGRFKASAAGSERERLRRDRSCRSGQLRKDPEYRECYGRRKHQFKFGRQPFRYCLRDKRPAVAGRYRCWCRSRRDAFRRRELKQHRRHAR